jgi:hypothetical protein
VTSREHGSRSRYVWGPDENGVQGNGCRCAACTTANRQESSHRERMKLYGRWEPFVDAGPAREHVRMLGAAGVGWKRVAELAAVSTSVISKLIYGGPGARPPTRRIRPQTEQRILAVQAARANLGARALVDATATRRRLQALVAAGWPKARLAARLGMLPGNFADVMERSQVLAATDRAVAVLYEQLWDQRPREATHHQKIAASRARNYARARGWVPPMAWDDDTIADPAAMPADGWQRPRRHGPLRGAELAAEAEELLELGVSHELAAARLGVKPETLKRALLRARKAAA